MKVISQKASIVIAHDDFSISLADTQTINSANSLLNKMYEWRGYGSNHKIPDSPTTVTLTAFNDEKVIGTLTLGIDSKEGLLADELFKNELDLYREFGKGKICELTKLAFDKECATKEVLASLFHTMFIYGDYVHKCTDAFIEVNPRHRRFYESMLGFKRIGEVKSNPRVNAPAQLLHLDLLHGERQIHKMGREASDETRSLYPYFFSLKDEASIYGEIAKLGS